MDPISVVALMLWSYIAADVEKLYSKSHGGSPHIDLKKGFCAILRKIQTGTQWRFLSSEYIRHKSSIFRLYQKMCNNDIFNKLFIILLRKAIDLHLVDFSWVSMDGTIIQAPLHIHQVKEAYCGRNPTDRGRCGTKILFICDDSSIPLGFLIIGANESEIKHIQETIQNMCENCGDKYLTFKGVRNMCMDKGYDSAEARDLLFALGFEEHIRSRGEEKRAKEEAEKKTEEEKKKEDNIAQQNQKTYGDLPPEKNHRWSIERLNSWVKGFHDFRTRRAHSAKHFEGVVLLVLSVILLRKIKKSQGVKVPA